MYKFILDVEIYDDKKHQAKYLVHGYDDVYWCDTFDEASNIIRGELIRYENGDFN